MSQLEIIRKWLIPTQGVKLGLGLFLPGLFVVGTTIAHNVLPRHVTNQFESAHLICVMYLMGAIPYWGWYLYRSMLASSRAAGRNVGAAYLMIAVLVCGGLSFAESQGHRPDAMALFGLAFWLGVIGLVCFLTALAAKTGAAEMAVTSLEDGKTSRAMEFFKLAALLGGEEGDNLRTVCLRLYQAEAAPLALQILKLGTEWAPKDVNNWSALADIAYYSGERETAMNAFEKALKLDPRNPDIPYDRAVKLSREPASYEQALQDYTKSISLDSSNPKALANRAALYNCMGRHELALADAKKAYQLDPSDRVAVAQGLKAASELGEEAEVSTWSSR